MLVEEAVTAGAGMVVYEGVGEGYDDELEGLEMGAGREMRSY